MEALRGIIGSLMAGLWLILMSSWIWIWPLLLLSYCAPRCS